MTQLIAALVIALIASAVLVMAEANAFKGTGDRLLTDSESAASLGRRSLSISGTQVGSERRSFDKLAKLYKKKKVVDDVFKVLNLNTALDDLLTHANWGTWLRYVDDVNSVHPDDHRKGEVLLDTLLKHYDDQSLLQKLAKAKESQNTGVIATALESQLKKRISDQMVKLVGWKNKNLGPDDISTAFPVKEYSELDDIVGSIYWGTWVKYVDNIAPDADKVSLILNPLMLRFKDNFFEIVKTIATFHSDARYKYLEDLLFTKWLAPFPNAASVRVEKVKRIFAREQQTDEIKSFMARYAIEYRKRGRTESKILSTMEDAAKRSKTL
ncbi:hypothetical protein F443_09538 [Phytophthora nicotianae P1569]|uniref:RxLR effector protein n=1 Tax=Phytophthora nicotianae P1569 TaxID=1317065 RepID=V9F4N5_PHYNI|nr:hypothetical protein F443_09538 [Phytophthora nicotianae P1569]